MSRHAIAASLPACLLAGCVSAVTLEARRTPTAAPAAPAADPTWCLTHAPVLLPDEAARTLLRFSPAAARQVLADNDRGIAQCK